MEPGPSITGVRQGLGLLRRRFASRPLRRVSFTASLETTGLVGKSL